MGEAGNLLLAHSESVPQRTLRLDSFDDFALGVGVEHVELLELLEVKVVVLEFGRVLRH